MKEIISVVLLIVSLFTGTQYLKQIHDSVRKAALEKAAQGLPSLVEFNNALHIKKKRALDR
jgi:hypothetical protein